MGPPNLSLLVSISPGSPRAAKGAPGCLQPGWASAGPPAGPLRSGGGRAARGRPNSARDRPWPAAWRCPRGVRHHPAQGIAPPGRRRSQGPTYPRPGRREDRLEQRAAMRRGRGGRPSRPEEAPERGLRPRPTPTVASALPWRRSGGFLSKRGAPPPARPNPAGRWKE